MWENFVIMERIKRNAYSNWTGNCYFWRTNTGAEIDYVEESQGRLSGYEIKFGKKKPRRPNTFLDTYHGSSWNVVSRENWMDFVLG